MTTPSAGRHGERGDAVGELLVTGEAVVLEVRLARLPSRALALGLDVLVQVAVLIVLLFAVGTLIRGARKRSPTRWGSSWSWRSSSATR